MKYIIELVHISQFVSINDLFPAFIVKTGVKIMVNLAIKIQAYGFQFLYQE